jgi:Family of unknown function (DUF5946)
MQCELCGAFLLQDRTCQSIHEEILVFEGSHALPHSLHFLHVTCFLSQHNHYSDEGLRWAQSLLRANLDENLTEFQYLQLLRTSGKRGGSVPHTWKFQRVSDASSLPKIAWSMTVVDVFKQIPDIRLYGEYVRLWAHATLQEMPPLLNGVK